MSLSVLAWASLALAAVPASMLVVNLPLLRAPPRPLSAPGPISVLVPARDEEGSIEDCLAAVLASEGVEFEVVVLDDHSSDSTAALVEAIAERDARVRLERAPELPAGWNGKQHACARLAEHARHDLLCFLDADVRLAPEALLRLAGSLERSGAGMQRLPAGVDREPRRGTDHPAHPLRPAGLPALARPEVDETPLFAAACGQLVLARRDAYETAGGHAAIRASRHDGVTLPRAFRTAGLATDLVDATRLARCRMYRGFGQTFGGFLKNATEGMAAPAAIGVWTVLLVGGHVLPFVLLPLAWCGLAPAVAVPAAAGVGFSLGARLVLALRFRQSLLGALLHPIGVLLVLSIQWIALVRQVAGRPVAWKGRVAS